MHFRQAWLRLVLLLAALLAAPTSSGADLEAAASAYFPGATSVGPLAGSPPAAEVRDRAGLIGYLFLTGSIAPVPGYSGQPIDTLVALGRDGQVRGIRIDRHQEPILGAGATAADLASFVDQYRGLKLGERVQFGGAPRAGYASFDALSGATITSIAFNAAVESSLRQVAQSRGLAAGGAQGPTAPAWQPIWRDQWPVIAVLIAGLLVLIALLLAQDWLVRRPRLLSRLRCGYLIFTVVFIGGVAAAQLSVFNVLTFVDAILRGFRWETFLVDPKIFLLWTFVAAAVLLWGRGVYCGWLCPFGAAQELIHKAARKLKLPRIEFPQVVHERLVALKYVIFLALLGLSLQSLLLVEPFLEVEPFETVFALHFQRPWLPVLYALGLLALSAFNPKFYCKYLCPLGGALALPTRLRVIDWLRRRKECGNPCQACAKGCDIRAIKPTGEINAHECHHCLDCQVTYWDKHTCPPLVELRKRLERQREREQALARHQKGL